LKCRHEPKLAKGLCQRCYDAARCKTTKYRRRYRKDRAKRIKLQAAWYQKNRKKILAYRYKNRVEIAAATRLYQLKHRGRYANRRRKVKLTVLTHYGKGNTLCCRWRGCQVRNLDGLTLDHINNDGAKHRNKIRYKIHHWILKNGLPKGFQTLCGTHQLIKEIQRRRRRAGLWI
jgi:hypothetical protein